MKPDEILIRLGNCKVASRRLRTTPAETKNAALLRAASLIEEQRETLLKANADDLQASPSDWSAAFRDRLTLDANRIAHIAESLRQVAALPDPVNELVDERELSNGLRTRRVRSPLGIILMIFESRPNVAVEAFSLAFKAGNVAILRGGKESMKTTAAFYQILTESLAENKIDPHSLWGITDPDRSLTDFLLQQRDWIDVVVPRGGAGLIKYVIENTEIPIIKNDRGLCHVYVHEDADLEMARKIVINAKTDRPGVCNSMETLLVQRPIAKSFLRALSEKMKEVEWRCCQETLRASGPASNRKPATSEDYDTEHLDLIMNVRVVDSLEAAIEHIEKHGSKHSEAIVTRSPETARKFEAEVDAAVVYWNASTRFTDGFALGLGGELGISTQKLHVRGPVGLSELTSIRWIIEGEGQTR